jgi:hypothetical protein
MMVCHALADQTDPKLFDQSGSLHFLGKSGAKPLRPVSELNRLGTINDGDKRGKEMSQTCIRAACYAHLRHAFAKGSRSFDYEWEGQYLFWCGSWIG